MGPSGSLGLLKPTLTSFPPSLTRIASSRARLENTRVRRRRRLRPRRSCSRMEIRKGAERTNGSTNERPLCFWQRMTAATDCERTRASRRRDRAGGCFCGGNCCPTLLWREGAVKIGPGGGYDLIRGTRSLVVRGSKLYFEVERGRCSLATSNHASRGLQLMVMDGWYKVAM